MLALVSLLLALRCVVLCFVDLFVVFGGCFGAFGCLFELVVFVLRFLLCLWLYLRCCLWFTC